MKLPPPDDTFVRLSRYALIFLLCYSVLIMWVPGLYINPTSYQAGLFFLIAVWALRIAYRPFAVAWSFPILPLLAASIWGGIQLAARSTVSRWETEQGILTWSENLAAFVIALQVGNSYDARRRLLKAITVFAFAITVISVLQFFSMPSMVLWVHFDGYGSVFGPFENRDRYAAFAELMIPVALWLALTDKNSRSKLFFVGVAATMFSAVIAASSRAGFILCSMEICGFWFLARKRFNGSLRFAGLQFGILAVLFTLVVGYSNVLHRFEEQDPYFTRKQLVIASVQMIKEKPLLGFGLGNFVNAYPAHATLDINKLFDQAHNDWAQWACEGGLPFLFLIAAVALWAFPLAIRSLWGIGVLSVFAHSCVDLPLQAHTLEFWTFALLGTLAAESDTIQPGT